MDEQICPVCQLFECIGWIKKFKIEILVNEIYKDHPSYGFEGELETNIREKTDSISDNRKGH
ncbi:hypothetical protein [Methanobacterium formicicum]|uniref:hypothetical protein n=1 Tax=Methanobacterium formicicum TaxID=2162 RepID=UPI001E4C6E0C|nr:hypothetical protein [Methanobacterium formicicum]